MQSAFSTETRTQTPVYLSVPIKKELPISTPIKIPTINKSGDESEYALNCQFFNPGKMSPPDNWKNRLEQRIKLLHSFNGNNE